jgi:hypothetical protein
VRALVATVFKYPLCKRDLSGGKMAYHLGYGIEESACAALHISSAAAVLTGRGKTVRELRTLGSWIERVS